MLLLQMTQNKTQEQQLPCFSKQFNIYQIALITRLDDRATLHNSNFRCRVRGTSL